MLNFIKSIFKKSPRLNKWYASTGNDHDCSRYALLTDINSKSVILRLIEITYSHNLKFDSLTFDHTISLNKTVFYNFYKRTKLSKIKPNHKRIIEETL